MGNAVKIIGSTLILAGICFLLFIREFGRFADEIYPYDE